MASLSEADHSLLEVRAEAAPAADGFPKQIARGVQTRALRVQATNPKGAGETQQPLQSDTAHADSLTCSAGWHGHKHN